MVHFVYGPELDEGGYPPSVPFDTRRPGRVARGLSALGLLDGADRRVIAPGALTRAEAARFHTPAYLAALERAGGGVVDARALAMGIGTPDCPPFPRMLDYLLLAAGGTVTGARALRFGEATAAFAPAGGFHHAHAARASGFCYLNDLVVAILELLQGGWRVLYVDVDAHHGDGVQEAFYASDRVMTISLHESGDTLYPGTGFVDEIGRGPGRGYAVNFPLPVGTDDDAFLHLFRAGALPLARAFAPDAIVLQLGMDALAGDPLAHLSLSNNAHVAVVEAMLEFGRPLLVTGGGGYALEQTVRGWMLAWSVLTGDQAEHDAMAFGMGGVMRQTTDWAGGLRDRSPPVPPAQRRARVDAACNAVLTAVRARLFPLHGLGVG